MPEQKKDDVGTTGDRLGEGGAREATGRSRSAEGDVESADNATAASKGTIGSGSEDADLSQASGGSVD